jgi:hypothetical protein
LAVRIPHGGVWLHRLSGPPFVAVALFVLLTAGGAGGAVRRRKRGTMSRHAAGRARTTTRRARVETPAATAALAGVVVGGFALAAVAWSTPTQRTTTVDDARTQTMTFDYVAHVRRTAAYDGTVVHAPSPVFRAVANTVDVDYAYAGQPGSLVMTAELGTPAGWHSDVKLAAPVTVGSARYQGHVTLNLAALWARGQAAAKVTGLPIEQMSVTIALTVTAPTGEPFAASLPLTLSQAQIGLTDADTSHLTVSKPYHVTRLVLVDRQWTALHRSISVARARLLALALLAFAVMGAAALAVYRRRTAAAGEAAAITRRHADLLVEVEPIAWIPGRPLVDVRTFQTLARIAERYGLVVFHWARVGVDTYLVQDEAATYRYRTGAASRTVPGAPGEAGVDRSSEMVAP